MRDETNDVELAMTEAEWEEWEKQQPPPRPDPPVEPSHPERIPDGPEA
jgi:hypothetical protein